MTKGNSMNAGSNKARRLVVIPTNPISAYEAAGIDWLESYYNPAGMFDEVFAVSPLEKGRRQAHGMTILGVKERNFGTVLRELKPDVVRAYGGYWQSDLACLHRIPGVPVIVSQHEPLPILPHKSIRYADLVICVSPSAAQSVMARGVEPGRIRVLPNRVDTRKFHPIADGNALVQVGARFPPGRHILHVGRRSPEKNLDTLIRALRHLPQDYSCISVGQGSETARCKALASQLAVGSRCHWIESVPNSELPQWYSWCDCMCTPSRYEGFGIVFVEAAACGAAIVTSDIAPMNEYLTHGVSGHLVPQYEDPAALAQAIQAVCEDAPYRQRLSQGAVAAAKRFDSAAIDLQEHGIYAEALRLSPRTIPASSLHRIRLGRNLDRIGEVARTLRSGAAHPRRFLAGVRPRAGAAARAVFHGICRCVNRALRVAPAWVMPGRAYALLLQRVGGRSGAERVLEWLRRAELGSGGIYVHSASGVAYPEVSGYLVPTLLKHGEVRLSQRILTWLLAIQRADGAYPDYEGTPRVFDTGQVLRGLLAGADTIPGTEDAARRSMEYLFGQMVDQGRGGFGNCYDKSIPEAVNLYVLPPLIEAARRFNDPRVISAANACLEYFCRHETFLRVDDLTHFLCYELDALIDLGRGDLAAPVLQRMLGAQRPDGAVRGVGGARWVCSPGLAQLAICWYKSGHRKAADRALAWLERHQRLSGGFLGSYGRGAAYFQDVELSWAAKFFLEAHLLRISSFIEEHIEEFPSHVDRSDGRCRSVAAVVKPGDRILECGCGKGRFLKAIKDAFPDVECTGVDISEKMLAHLPPGIRGRQGALEQLPLPSASYDVVFSVEAIEHSINKEAAIAEMIRVAKPGGYVIVVDKQKSHWGALKCPPWERWPAREEIVKLLQRECDDVSAQPVDYGARDVDGLMLAWQGRKRSRLSGAGWNRQLVRDSTRREVLDHVTHARLSEWAQCMLSSTSPGQRVLEIGGGTGEISLHLANAGRIVSVLDIDQDSLDFVRSCAGDLGLSVDTIRSDATVPLAMTDGQFDCVWSAGLLEHFTAAERIPILKEWARITTDTLIILVPNASCLPYQIWKQREESAGTWPYGIETPVVSLQKELLAAGMARVEEFSVGIRHALTFLPPRDPLRKALEALAKDRASDWMQESNQGYLLVTIGHKGPRRGGDARCPSAP